MKNLSVNFKNCYGIKKLDYVFDFTKKNAYIIYASNGVMKTSFAKTFSRLSQGKEPVEEAFKRIPVCIVKKDGLNINPENIFVINSYENEYISPNSAKLMVSKTLKEKYDTLMDSVIWAIGNFENQVRSITGSDLNVQVEMTEAYKKNPSKFLDLIMELLESDELNKVDSGLNFKKIKYTDIFNENVAKFVSEPKNLKLLRDYETQYSKLLEGNKLFKRGVFSHYNLDMVTSDLISNNFFEANHEVKLCGIDETINNPEELRKILDSERERVFTNPQLKKDFDKINTQLGKKALGNFRTIIEKYPEIIPMLTDYKEFKIKAWRTIIKQTKTSFISLSEHYQEKKYLEAEIRIKAKDETTLWEQTMSIFNSRFRLPVKVNVPNIDDVMLSESTPEFAFSFIDDETSEEALIERKKLEGILSQGEKKALYLLNIINDLESIKAEGREVLVIADDLADSFDYRNKYAIIEYLQEVSLSANFKLIILTHNFDFFRSIASRSTESIIPKMVVKRSNSIIIDTPKYVFKNPFTQIKHSILSGDKMSIITAIPFIRNIIEYSNGSKDEDYIILTSLLHLKDDTMNITLKDLEDIFNRNIHNQTGENFNFSEMHEEIVVNLIHKLADVITLDNDEKIDIDGKIVLSIASRLFAESFVINEIIKIDGNNLEVDKIRKSGSAQTGKLFALYKKRYPNNQKKIKMLDEVNLMTSENIHVNSFMFEPIIDMSVIELTYLYKKLKASIL